MPQKIDPFPLWLHLFPACQVFDFLLIIIVFVFVSDSAQNDLFSTEKLCPDATRVVSHSIRPLSTSASLDVHPVEVSVEGGIGRTGRLRGGRGKRSSGVTRRVGRSWDLSFLFGRVWFHGGSSKREQKECWTSDDSGTGGGFGWEL